MRVYAQGAAIALFASVNCAAAADVTPERLRNPEPRNWLHHHGDWSSHRFSALKTINKANAGKLRMAFAVALGGSAGNENLTATPLVDDGFMFMTDAWGVLYKIDVRSGASGSIVWKMDPGQQKIDRNRGAALWGNLVISTSARDGHVIAVNKDTGAVVWDKNLADKDQPELTLNSAPLAIEDAILVGASGGDQGVRNWVAALDAKTGAEKWRFHSVPAPGEPGHETWKDNNNAWQTGGGSFYNTGSYDPRTKTTYWGSGNPTPKYDSSYRPGDNLYTNSALALDAGSGKLKWHHQYTPNDTMDFDESGSHLLIDGKFGAADRKQVVRAARNGFVYAFDQGNGQFLKATQYVSQVTWTKGIDPKTGKPLDYDPTKDLQTYAEPVSKILTGAKSSFCPGVPGGNNFWPASYSEKTRLLYIPSLEGCTWVTRDQTRHVPGKFDGGSFGYDGRLTSSIVAYDPASGEIKRRKDLPYPNTSGIVSTAGGIIITALLDGTVMALDDETLEELWSINLGAGINAPPITYEVDGKQYIAIATGLTGNQVGRISTAPEMKGLAKNTTMLFVFSL